MIQQDEYNTEWLLWAELRAERVAPLPALDWSAMGRVRRQLRVTLEDNNYTTPVQRMAFYKAARSPGTWQRCIVAKCAEQAPVRIVYHWARGYFAGPGCTPTHAMERAA